MIDRVIDRVIHPVIHNDLMHPRTLVRSHEEGWSGANGPDPADAGRTEGDVSCRLT